MKPEAAFHWEPGSYTGSLELSAEDLALELESASTWDVAVRYHEFRALRPSKERLARVRKLSAEVILERARKVLGSLVHPTDVRTAHLADVPIDAEDVELDLEETLDASPQALASGNFMRDDLVVSYHLPRPHSLVLCVDTSLSMTGEKLALTAVAIAVVLLQFPRDQLGIIAFENEARVIKHPDERINVSEMVERFLDVPAQGYTHLEAGLREALRMTSRTVRNGARRVSTLLLTDGKYTAGRDPGFLAPRFQHLTVLKMGAEKASHDLCAELARKGRGSLREVADLEVLPQAMYSIVKDLLRGRALA